MNKTYKIGKNAGYDGCGLCLAAISENEAIKVKYLRDLCPDYDGEDMVEDWLRWGTDSRVKAAALEMEQYAYTSVGMASCWEFIEL